MKKELTIKIILITCIALAVIAIGFVGYGIINKLTNKIQNPIVSMEIENYGTIKIELYPDKAPNTVTNFICLANNGFYNGLTFHRTIPGFMIQGGDKQGTGTGTPSLDDLKKNGDDSLYSIKGEMIANGYTQNTLKLERGVIAMARSDYSSISSSLAKEGYNSAGSQFFILQEDNEYLNGVYAGFGKVIEGIEIVDQIANLDVTYRDSDLGENEEVPKDENGESLIPDMPLNKPVITSVTVDTFGVNYGEPETMEPFNYYNFLMQYYNSLYGTQY